MNEKKNLNYVYVLPEKAWIIDGQNIWILPIKNEPKVDF